MAKRQLATVVKIIDECETVKTMEFRLSEPVSPQPGQCGTFFLLKEDGSFGEGRVYSLSSAPFPGDSLAITFRMTPNFPAKLASLKPGNKVGFFGPYGNFVFGEPAESVVFLAGGVGISPLLSMIRFIDGKKLPVKMVLIHSNQTVQVTPFLEYFKGLQSRNRDFRYVLDLTKPKESAEWAGLKEEGYLSEEMIRKHVPECEKQTYYICGPPGYAGAAISILKKIGVQQEKVKFEQW